MRKLSLVRAGFTLTEVAVAAAIFAILAAVVFATVHGSTGTTTKRIGDAATALRELTGALHRFDTASANLISGQGRMPLEISHLTNPVTLTQRNSCGSGLTPPSYSLYVTREVNGWVNGPGPFYSRDVVPGVGFPLSIGFVHDTLVRTPATVTAGAQGERRSWGILQVRINNVSFADAQELNALVDADNSATTGTIRWTAAPDAEGMLSSIFWTIPVGGC